MIKIVSIIFVTLVLLIAFDYATAYDGTIKDKYGRTTGYVDYKKNGDTQFISITGQKANIIKADGTIKNNKGQTTGYIKENK